MCTFTTISLLIIAVYVIKWDLGRSLTTETDNKKQVGQNEPVITKNISSSPPRKWQVYDVYEDGEGFRDW